MIIRSGEVKEVNNPKQSVSVESGGTVIITAAKHVYCEAGSKYALKSGEQSCETLYVDEKAVDVTHISKLSSFGD